MPEYLLIYDHNLLAGKEDSNYDPTDAILYFYPTSTPIDYQHALCSHVMGFCQILSNIFQSPPKLFTLDTGSRIACVHEPELGLIQKTNSQLITFALYSENQSSIHLHEKCKLMYESLIFYMKKCLACIFSKGKSKSNYVTNIINKLMILINHRDNLSTIYNTSLYCDHDEKNSVFIDPLLCQTMINTIDSICHQSENFKISILGSCVFFKKILILNQFSVEMSNLFSILIDNLNNETNKSGKEKLNLLKRIKIDTDELHTRNGVYLFKICITNERYQEILNYSKINSKSQRKNCCDNEKDFQFIHLYLEHHSNTTIILLFDEPDSQNLNGELFKVISNLCFKTLGDIETHISINKSRQEERVDKLTTGSTNQWNITYDEVDKTITKTNSFCGISFAADWEEWLLKRANVLHSNLEKEKSIKEIHVKIKKEHISAQRYGNQQIYIMKSTN